MRSSYVLLLVVLAISALVHPSAARGFSERRMRKISALTINAPSERDKNLAGMRATSTALKELGAHADESALYKRVEELKDQRLREEFPEAYMPRPRPKRHANSDDIWENGTVVRYIARCTALLLAMATLYACKEQIMGRETFDGKKIRKRDNTKKNR